ncbi:MAG TPA: tRNA epoxyqueuosine(34) reductase QueG [Gemmatimonadaceae bacterium]|nr:tRNA epoxyqueuosine(34) reductase QueG [Gemmatimonadaceae bacterium]
MIAARSVPSAERIKAEAYALGFDLAGIAALGPMETAAAYARWLEAGQAGEMEYLRRGAEARGDSRRPYAGARSAIVVALDYGGREPSGPVARYARGDDYHDVMTARLRALHRWLEMACGAPVAGKAYVDTGPVLERDLARRAGLGWFGKNTNLIHPKLGSFFLLGALFVEQELAPDPPFATDHCGTCRRCLDACPTHAIVDDGVVDARRCVSYLTIELRGPIPEALREPMGELLFGCDICQEVCPWNEKFARALPEGSPFAPREALGGRDARALAREILGMSREDYVARFRGSPLKRPKRRGLQRNAAVVLGNAGTAQDVPALVAALWCDEPLVRGHAAWALGRIGSPAAAEAIRARAKVEPDDGVLQELRAALGG